MTTAGLLALLCGGFDGDGESDDDDEASAAGFYTSPVTGTKFPKIQLLTIEDLIAGKQTARYPSLDAGGLTFKKAQVEQGEDKQHDLFAAPAKSPRKRKPAKG